MESIAMTLIGVTVTPIGVVESNSSRKWPWSGATLTRFCDELV